MKVLLVTSVPPVLPAGLLALLLGAFQRRVRLNVRAGFL